MGGLLYIFFVAAVAYFAKSKGRSPLGWALIAVFISPLLASIILFFLKNLNTDRYDGDTIDTTSTPIPDENSRRYPEHRQLPADKTKADVDESIRRMEEKLARTKSNEASSDTVETSNSVNGTVTGVILPSVKDNQNDTKQSYEDVKENVTDEIEVIEMEPVETEQKEVAIEDATLVNSTIEPKKDISPSHVCESCGQPLTPGGKFCTNCGAPVAK